MFIPPIIGVFPSAVGLEMWQGILLWRDDALSCRYPRLIDLSRWAISEVSDLVVEE
jgi:hypothetical protein